MAQYKLAHIDMKGNRGELHDLLNLTGAEVSCNTLPAGATAVRTAEVRRQVTDWFLTKEKANTNVIFTVDGFSFSGSGQNAGMAFVSLKNWSQRKGDDNTAQAIALRATKELGTIRDATLFAMTPPSVDGLGQSNGFTFELMASGGTDRDSLMKLRSQLLAAANQSSELQSVRANDLPQMPQLQVDIDNNKAVSLGLSLSDVTDTLSSAWGGTYVNDFIDRGRVKKVYIQGESDARAVPSDLGKWFVRGSDNSMTPFSAFATTHWQYGPESLVRYNGSAAFEIQGENAAGFSSGAAMDKMEKLADSLPAGSTWAWSGMSLQEKLASGQAMSLYAISILVVFLCLAALYESWEPVAAALRALYQQELDGFSHEPAQLKEQPAEKQPDLGNPPAPEPAPRMTTTPVTRYPGEQNHLPYDVEIHTLHIEKPEHTPPQPTGTSVSPTFTWAKEGRKQNSGPIWTLSIF